MNMTRLLTLKFWLQPCCLWLWGFYMKMNSQNISNLLSLYVWGWFYYLHSYFTFWMNGRDRSALNSKGFVFMQQEHEAMHFTWSMASIKRNSWLLRPRIWGSLIFIKPLLNLVYISGNKLLHWWDGVTWNRTSVCNDPRRDDTISLAVVTVGPQVKIFSLAQERKNICMFYHEMN